MKTVAIMQPYFIPYAGYFRLFAAADEVVMLDDVQFPRRGYVHRNRLVRRDGSLDWLTLPVQHGPIDLRIRDLKFQACPAEELQRRLRRFETGVAPGAGRALLMSAIIGMDGRTPADFIVGLLADYCEHLCLPFTDLRASSLELPADLRGQSRIIAIAKERQATTYLNLAGGRTLYDLDAFHREGVDLRFLVPYAGPIDSICAQLDIMTSEALRREIVEQSVVES